MNLDHGSVGTTTLGLKYHIRNVEQRQFNQNMKMTNDGGVLLAVDYRATGEMHIGSGCMKIIEIHKFLLGTMAGGADDCTYWERVLSKQVPPFHYSCNIVPAKRFDCCFYPTNAKFDDFDGCIFKIFRNKNT